MRVLVACEYSGNVREAFAALGHFAAAMAAQWGNLDTYGIQGELMEFTA